MTPTDDTLKQVIDRHLPSPSPLELTSSHDRLLSELRSAPPRLLRPRLAETAPASRSRSTSFGASR